MDKTAIEQIKLAIETAIDNHDLHQPQAPIPNREDISASEWSIWFKEKEIFDTAMKCMTTEQREQAIASANSLAHRMKLGWGIRIDCEWVCFAGLNREILKDWHGNNIPGPVRQNIETSSNTDIAIRFKSKEDADFVIKTIGLGIAEPERIMEAT